MRSQESYKLSCGFSTGWNDRFHNWMFHAKYALMRQRGVIYPDSQCFPFWLGARCAFLRNGASVGNGRYDFIFSELNTCDVHLQYLIDITATCRERLVILPGPPEIFHSSTNSTFTEMARHLLRTTGHVLAYSPGVKSFADTLAGREVATVTRWPFDYAATLRIANTTSRRADRRKHVLIGIPLRFQGVANNQPEHLAQALRAAVEEISAAERAQLVFHAFVYTPQDRRLWAETDFGRQLNIRLARARSYPAFIRFVAGCDAVINLSAVQVLGRNTFISAALRKPGIFSANVALNRTLYPGALLSGPGDEALFEKARSLIRGLLEDKVDGCFFPDDESARAIGDYHGNAETVRRLLGLSCPDNKRRI